MTAKTENIVLRLIEEIEPEPEWVRWYQLTPVERLQESLLLWEHYLNIGGSLEAEPDSQSPFFDPQASVEKPFDGRSGLRIIRRSGV